MDKPIPSVALITICLNEMEWLPHLWEQHRGWPGLVRWCFVEGADHAYAEANPKMVSEKGLSVDGTTQFLEGLARSDPSIVHVPFGKTEYKRKETGKIALKATALRGVENDRPDFVIALDADEFYPRKFQARIGEMMSLHPEAKGFIFPRREIWRPPSVSRHPLFNLEVKGGFWGIPCSHWWRWEEGMRFLECHNTPFTREGIPFNNFLKDFRDEPNAPYMIHLGFASSRETRLAKNAYYASRGEAQDRQRKWYVSSRDAWRTWKPGDQLPRSAEVLPYLGSIPECFAGKED